MREVIILWFRYRKGLVAETERYAHLADWPITGSYLVSPCGQQFDRDDTEEVPAPVDDPPRHAPEPCAICVMRMLLTPPHGRPRQ